MRSPTGIEDYDAVCVGGAFTTTKKDIIYRAIIDVLSPYSVMVSKMPNDDYILVVVFKKGCACSADGLKGFVQGILWSNM
jgi:hypothetical protein